MLVTAQGISNNYFKLWAEGLQSSNNEKPADYKKYKMTLRVAYIHPLPTLEKNLKVPIKVTNDLPDVSSQEESEGTNQTGNGVQGGVLVGETVF